MRSPPDASIPWHYLRPNEAVRMPRRIVCFDTEARIDERRSGQRHSFRLGAASFDRLATGGNPTSDGSSTVEFEPLELWRWIDGHTRSRGRLVCFAHNLAYDLRLSAALTVLPRLGWSLRFLTLDSSRCVARYTRDGRSLILTDLFSWLPCSLERIAGMVGLRKPPLPSQDAPESAWAARCLADVAITRAAVLELLAWLERNEAGSFRLTGAAQASACYRHRFMPRAQLLVHQDTEAKAAERRAAWTGRCEAWRWGEVAGPLYEWDFELAYLRLARTLYLPVHLRGQREGLSLAELRRLTRHRAILAECRVESPTPLLPAERDARIVWPVGTFDTCVWDRELLAAVDRGAAVSISRAWLYDKQPALNQWASWLLERLGPDGEPVDSLQRIMLKHWARALIGRFGARWPAFDKIATLPNSALELVPGVDLDTGESYAHLQVEHDWFERSGLVDAPDAMPAVMGYVMSAARVRLLAALEMAGADHVVYLDTDSLIVDRAGDRALATWAGTVPGEDLRRKGRYARALIHGPRQLQLDDEVRVAGLKRNSVHRGGRKYESELWEGLAESVRRGHPGQVWVARRAFTLNGSDPRRRHLPGGRTAPHRL